jgi:uncharacterized membrane protein YfcA
LLIALLLPLGLGTIVYAISLFRAVIARRAKPRAETLALGAVVNFLDTLGIGSFAPTMAWLKFRRLVPDRIIPCTMLVGLTLPTMVEAVIFLILLGVSVDPVLLVGCVIAVLLGAVLGVPLAARARVAVVQTVVGVALIVAAILYAMSNLHLMPGGGTASSLSLPLTIAAIAANFVFGILLNFGVGNYAPTLAMLSLMGMDPRLCFPIMAGGAALAATGASVGHIARGEVDLRVAVGLAIGGVPAVFVAAFVVKAMSVDLLRWLVIVVVLYAAFVMLRSALRDSRGAPVVAQA